MSALVPRDTPNLIFPDKLIRVRTNEKILPAYLWQVLQSFPVRAQIEAAARTAVGNYAIGTDDIWNLQIPLPPLEVQTATMQRVRQGREEITRERAAIEQLRKAVVSDINSAVFGRGNA